MNEFLKQAKSKRFFMPVLSLDQPLECRRFVFLDVPSTDVGRAFDDAGGLAIAVNDMNQLEVLKRNMMSAAQGE